MISAPILVQSSVSLGAGALAQFNANDLTHPFDQAVLVREIYFSLFYTTAHGGDGNLGNSIRLSLNLGRVGITSLRNYVPIWNFGKRISEFLETVSISAKRKNSFCWVLPRPLLIPPRCSLTAVATRQQSDFLATNDAGNAVTCRLAYSGIAMPKNFRMPERIDVPFVSAYMDTDTSSVGHSNELDLINPTDQPLKIQRLIGRANYFATVPTDLTVSKDYLGALPTIRIRTNLHRDIVGTYLQFNEVFDPLGRNLEIRHTLDPRENFDIDINEKLTGTNAMTPTISMIGHRSVPVREI